MEDGRTGEVTPMDEMIRHPGSVSAARLAGCKNFFAAEARDGKVYLPSGTWRCRLLAWKIPLRRLAFLTIPSP